MSMSGHGEETAAADECNKLLLKEIEKKLDEFLAKKKQNNGKGVGGVTAEEMQQLMEFGDCLWDPFAGKTINPIPEVKYMLSSYIVKHPKWDAERPLF